MRASQAGLLLALGVVLLAPAWILWPARSRVAVVDGWGALREQARGFSRVTRIEPYGLVARTPADWTCEPQRPGSPVACTGPCWTVTWDVEPETAAEATETLVAKLGADATTDLAGFHGGLVKFEATHLRPALTYTFDGWRSAPGQGRYHLRAIADACYSSEHRSTDGPAVLLTTAPGPWGLPDTFPSQLDLETAAKAESAYGDLADDARPEGWIPAVWQLFAERAPGYRDPLLVVDSLRARELDVSDLVLRRIDALMDRGSAGNFFDACRMATYLERWDPARAHEVRLAIGPRMRARAIAAASTPDEARFADDEIRFADDRARAGDLGAVGDAALYLLRLDPARYFREPGGVFAWLLEHHGDPDVLSVLDTWLDPIRNPVPRDARFDVVSAACRPWVPSIPAVQRHFLAMLDDRASAGVGFDEHGAMVRPPPGAWPASAILRVCDVYGYAVPVTAQTPAFDVSLTVPQRDGQLRVMRRYVASLVRRDGLAGR